MKYNQKLAPTAIYILQFRVLQFAKLFFFLKKRLSDLGQVLFTTKDHVWQMQKKEIENSLRFKGWRWLDWNQFVPLVVKNMVELENKRTMLIGYVCVSGYTPAVPGRSSNRKHFLRSQPSVLVKDFCSNPPALSSSPHKTALSPEFKHYFFVFTRSTPVCLTRAVNHAFYI